MVVVKCLLTEAPAALVAVAALAHSLYILIARLIFRLIFIFPRSLSHGDVYPTGNPLISG